jgi:cytochrome P450
MTLTSQIAGASGGWPMVGHTLTFLRRPLEFLASLPAQGDLVEIRTWPQRMVVVCCPDLVHQVLRDGRTFDKAARSMTRQEQYSVMALAPVRTALTNGNVGCCNRHLAGIGWRCMPLK